MCKKHACITAMRMSDTWTMVQPSRQQVAGMAIMLRWLEWPTMSREALMVLGVRHAMAAKYNQRCVQLWGHSLVVIWVFMVAGL